MHSTVTDMTATSATLTFGDVTVTRAVESVGSVGMTPEQFLPGTAPAAWQDHEALLRPHHLESNGDGVLDSTARVAFQSWVFRSGGKVVLFETAIGDDKDRPDVPSWSHLKTGFLDRLAATGIRPENVDIVVNSHLHADHIGWNTRLVDGVWVPTFPNARYLMPQDDLDFWDPERGADTIMGPGAHLAWADSIQPVLDAGQVTAWRGIHRIDENLTLEAAPGHTPGSAMLRVTSGDAEALFIGDTIHSPAQVHDHHTSSCFCEDPATAEATRIRVFGEAADKGLLMFPSHTPGHGGFTVTRDGNGFAFAQWAPLDAI
jgi:glyoxylase-like metal-dependent hydrolase (beta-lactamase superfamily II)